MPKLPNTDWQLESIRLSLFLAHPFSDESSGWWESVVGLPPESSTNKRATGESIDEGPLQENRLWLNRNSIAQRVDWIIHPPMGLLRPGVGPYQEWIAKFVDMMKTWLASANVAPVRVAFGITILSEVADTANGYKFLRAALPMIKFGEDWSEFSFQVNKRISSKVLAGTSIDDKNLNCLSKWNSIAMQMIAVDPSFPKVPDYHAVRVELDLNTTTENRDVLTVPSVVGLFDEFKSISDRFAAEGLFE